MIQWKELEPRVNVVEATVALLRVLEEQRFKCRLARFLCAGRPKRQAQEVLVPS